MSDDRLKSHEYVRDELGSTTCSSVILSQECECTPNDNEGWEEWNRKYQMEFLRKDFAEMEVEIECRSIC